MLRDLIREEDENCEQTLKNIFMRENVTKIMHGCDTDIKYLVADLGIVTYNLFDTARAFSFI
jgi:ribonuclease D